MKFFEFSQNNSGGSFICNDMLTNRVYIEAPSEREAIARAEDMGMYWNGVDEGMDCPCCGDRWSKPWRDDGMEFPYNYGAFTKKDAESIASKYGITIEKREDKKSYSNRDYDVVFPNIESYTQYMADEYGWESPDVYIHYNDGRKVSIFSSKVEKRKK